MYDNIDFESIKGLEMTKHLYETLVELVDLATDGQESRDNDADGPVDRLRACESNNALSRGKFYVEEYAERYRNGDLK